MTCTLVNTLQSRMFITHIYTSWSLCFLHRDHVYMYVCICVHCVCVYIRTWIYMPMHLFMRHACIYIYVHVCTCICSCAAMCRNNMFTGSSAVFSASIAWDLLIHGNVFSFRKKLQPTRAFCYIFSYFRIRKVALLFITIGNWF